MKNHKRLIALILVIALSGVIMNVVSAAKLTDAYKYTSKGKSTDVELANAINALQQLGIVAGVSQSTDKNGEITEFTFDGDALVTRQQFALFTARISTAMPSRFVVAPNKEIKTNTSFKDLVDKTYTLAIDYCFAEGYILGRNTENTIFDPMGNITFAEAVTMLTRSLGYRDLSYPTGFMSKASEKDVRLIGEYADFQMNNVARDTKITRAQMAMLLWNYLLSEKWELEMVYDTAKEEWDTERIARPILNSFGFRNANSFLVSIKQDTPSNDKYVVKFDLNYNNPVGKISDQTVTKGGYAHRPTTENVKRANYLLTGWYTDKDCKNEFSFDTKINSNITLFAKWVSWNDSASSYNDFMQITNSLEEIEKKYFNNQGYVDTSDFAKVMAEVEEHIRNLYEQGKILEISTINSEVIGFRQKDGGLTGFSPRNPEILIEGSDVNIITLSPSLPEDKVSEVALSALSDVVREYYSIPDMEIVKLLTTVRNIKAVSYRNNDVNFKALENLSGDIILYFGHGAYWNDEIGSVLATGIEITDETENSEIIKLYKGRDWIVRRPSSQVYAITAEYVKHCSIGSKMSKSIVYLAACSSLKGSNQNLAQAFLNRGALVVVGHDDVTATKYASYCMKDIMHKLTTINESTSVLYTIRDAINYAIVNNSSAYRTAKEWYNATGQVKCYPENSNFRLFDLVLAKPTGIKGTVIDRETNKPFVSGNFVVRLTKIVSGEISYGYPNSNGSFTMDCPAGTYQYEICNSVGYVYHTSGYITVKENEILDLRTIYLTEPLIVVIPDEPTGVKGMVLGTEYNEMLMGVTVTLTNTSTSQVYTGTTDIEGIYKIECTEGTYNIKFEKNGYITREKKNVQIRKDRTEIIENIYLKRDTYITQGIRVRVHDSETNEPIECIRYSYDRDRYEPRYYNTGGVFITLYKQTQYNRTSGEVVVYARETGDNGIVEFDVPEGIYLLVFNNKDKKIWNVVVTKDNVTEVFVKYISTGEYIYQYEFEYEIK